AACLSSSDKGIAKLARGDFEYLSPNVIPGFDVYLSFTGGPTLQRIEQDYGAPDFATARAAAKEEIDYAASLCEHPINTLLSLSRFIEGDAIREQFRIVPPPGDKPHTKIWEIVPDA
ncbi:MAG: DUF6505 family protein, partial [Ferrovibrio sp.]